MKKTTKFFGLAGIIFCSLFIFTNTSFAASVFHNFDNLPITDDMEVPNDGGGWKYSSHITNTRYHFFGASGWWNTQEYVDYSGVFERFYLHNNKSNNAHMGYTSFVFLEIDNINSVRGNSLKATVTGGNKK